MHKTLPQRFYTDPEFYKTELERFYCDRWVCAGRAEQIPGAGDYFTRQLGDESVILTRDGSGAIQALFNVCRHRGTRICQETPGRFIDRIQCPYHAWTYDLTGRLLAALGAENVAPHPRYIGGAMGFRDGIETMSVDGKRRREYLPGLSDTQRQHVFYFAVYPNLLLSLHPDYMMTHTLWPRAHNRTEIICEWHFHPAERAKPTFHADDAIEFWDQTNREDWWIAERSQQGISSRAYEPGPYSERETLLGAFDDVVREEARQFWDSVRGHVEG